MNDIIVLSAYPSSKESEQITLKSIEVLKKTNRKIILTSHCSVSKKIQDMVDYLIYDSNNVLLSDSVTYVSSWYSDWESSLNIGCDIGPAVYTNFYNGISLANHLGYDVVHCINYDILISDIDIFDNSLELYTKYDAVYNNIVNYECRDLDYVKDQVSTTLFSINTKYFLNNFPQINNEKEYTEWSNSVCGGGPLEKIFYYISKWSIGNGNVLLIEDDSEYKKLVEGVSEIASRCEIFNAISKIDCTDRFVLYYNARSSNGFGRAFQAKVSRKSKDGKDEYSVIYQISNALNGCGWWRDEIQYDSNYIYKVELKSNIVDLNKIYGLYNIDNQCIINKKIIIDDTYFKKSLQHSGWLKVK